MGVGCLVQGLGLALMLAGCVGGVVVGSGEGAMVGGVVGGLLGLILLIIGGRMALKWICGACKNPIADRSVQMCPTCRARLV